MRDVHLAGYSEEAIFDSSNITSHLILYWLSVLLDSSIKLIPMVTPAKEIFTNHK